MRILIVYATNEGHTRHLAEFVADRLRKAGHAVRLAAAQDAPAPESVDAALLAGSLHLLRYQRALVGYARRHRDALNALPSAFVSVSLAAADIGRGRAGLDDCVRRFQRATGWRPRAVFHAAGKIAFSAYGPLIRFAIRSIAASHGLPTETSQDYDLTDYAGLARFAEGFACSLSLAERPEPTPARRSVSWG